MEQQNSNEWNNTVNNDDQHTGGTPPKEQTQAFSETSYIQPMNEYATSQPQSIPQPNFTMVNMEQEESESIQANTQLIHAATPYEEATMHTNAEQIQDGQSQQEFTQEKEAFTQWNAQQNTNNQFADSQGFEQITTPPKKTKTNRFRTPLLVAGCLLVGGAGGFGGAYLANHVFGANGQSVIYQAVERKDSNGATVTNMSVKDVVANTENSVVEITTESAATDSYFSQMVTTGAGSGVIITKDGYIVTNNHVVSGANKITVRTKDGTEYDAKLIGTDEKTDLAVIKIEASNLNAAVLGTSSNLAVGDEAIAIGNPLGELGGTVTQGIISALDREITIDGQTMTLLQTDTAINKGNSGGGLFNNNGELIGIVNAKSSGTSVEGLGFAIPIDTAKPVIESLITSGYVTGRPQLGVSMVNVTDEMTAFQAGVNELGVYIAKVNDGSAADEAGFKVKDRVISVDGKEISSSSEIAKIIDGKKVGDTVDIVVERDGKEVTLKATLKEAQNTATSKNTNDQDAKQEKQEDGLKNSIPLPDGEAEIYGR